jgi:hypothetical protein
VKLALEQGFLPVYFCIRMLHNANGIDEQTVARREEGCLIQYQQKIL